METFAALRQSLCFEGLNHTELHTLHDERMRLKHYSDGAVVLKSDAQTSHNLVIVVSGALDVIRVVERRGMLEELPIHRYNRSDVMGLLEIVTEKTQNQATVKAVGETSVLRLRIPDFRAFLEEYPALGYSFCKALAHQLLEDGQAVAETKVCDATEKLARALQAEQERVDAGEKAALLMKSGDKKRLADELGICSKTVRTLLERFVEYGALQIVAGYPKRCNGKLTFIGTIYTLADRTQLKKIADGLSEITSTQY